MSRGGFLDAWRGYRRFTRLNARRFPVAFYSEMGSDRLYFEDLIRAMSERDSPVLYLTSSTGDPMAAWEHPDFHAVFIGSGLFRNLAFREVDADVFVTTMPDLGAFGLTRSMHPVHYVYVFHSLVSTHMTYRQKALEAFDTIFCVGPHHEAEIREAEALSGLPPKCLVPHGYPRLEAIADQYRDWRQRHERRQDDGRIGVLIAPTWGVNSIVHHGLESLVEILLAEGLDVTFRPHPMTVRDESHRIDRLRERIGPTERFRLDLDIARTESLFASDVMISDWSGVALEFALATGKPVVFLDVPKKVNNRAFERFRAVPLEVSIRERLGEVIGPERIAEVPAAVRRLVAAHRVDHGRFERLAEEIVYNYGRSREAGAEALAGIVDRARSARSPGSR